jgi:C_GCAxxG_C_C family probable redox protein
MEISEINNVDRAVACFEEGFSCSQAVLSAFAPQLGLERELALKVSGAFGGGMGHLGETCGAVTGAFMTIGLKHGRTQADDAETKERAYRLVQQFASAFQERHGSILCRELLGADLSTLEGRERVQETGISATLCPGFVRSAAEILNELFETDEQRDH